MPIKLNSTGGGSVTLDTPSTANNYTLLIPATNGSLATTTGTTFADITDSGNLTFTGTGNRITGDFSNATLTNRVAFQTSTTNSNTGVFFIPNGTAVSSSVQCFNTADPTNSGRINIQITSVDAVFESGITGTGSYLPMLFRTGGSERMRIDSSGNVGIGQSSPAASLDITNASNATQYWRTGTIQLFAQANDSQGLATFGTVSNHAVKFITNSAERMRIDSGGNLLVGTTAARASFTVVSDGIQIYVGPKTFGGGVEGGEIQFGRGTDGATAWYFDTLSGATPSIRIINAAATGVQVVNGQQAWSAYSDIRLKTDIKPLRSVLANIASIECINYHLTGIDTADSPLRIGVSAQSLVGKFDEVLDTVQKQGDTTDYLAVRYSDMVPYLVKAIQELKAELDELKAKVK